METFFANQLDYIYFIYGLAFVIMSIIVFYTLYETKLNLPLKWLGFFSLVHGLGQWFNLTTILFGHLSLFTTVRAIVIACSLGLLCETGRSGLSQLKIKVPGRWIYLVFGTLTLAGAFASGLHGFQTAANYTMGIVGAITTAAVFAISYKRDPAKNKYYLMFSGILICSGVIIIIGVPKASIFPAMIINYESVFKYLHVPIPFICAITGTIFTILMASFAYNLLGYNKNFQWKMKSVILFLPIFIVVGIVAGGWALTNYTSNKTESSRRHSFVHLAIATTSLFDQSQTASLTGMASDVSSGNYQHIKKQMADLRNKLNNDLYETSCRFIYLLALRNDKVIFLVDSEPENSKDMSYPGQIYVEASNQVIHCFADGKPFVEGPYSDQWGDWVSGMAAIRDSSGKVIAVLGIDVEAKEWHRSYALIRLFVIMTIMMISLIITALVIVLHILTSAAEKRLRTIEALEKSEEKYKTLIENLNVGIYSNTLENGGLFTEANTALAKLFGFETSEELKKTGVLDLYKDHDDRNFYIQRLKEFGSVKNFECVLQRKNGNQIITSISAQAYFDEEHKIKSIFGVMEDITERKYAEENLKKSRETLKKIIDSMPFGVAIIDKNKKIRLVNHKAIEMSGCINSCELVGRTCHNFICPANECNCPVLDLHQVVDMSEKIMVNKDGRKIPILKSVIPIMFDNEEVLLESFVDVTKQKEAEEKMLELNKSLEDANSELKNFAYIASHDLREPLRKITSFGMILQKSITDKISQDDNENLGYMIDGAKRMSQMIDGLLSYSRVSTKGREFETVEIDKLVAELKQYELGVLLEETHTIINIPQPLPVVNADLLQMRQLVQNLIANGIKYQKKGNIPEITITSKPAANGMVRIEITDNGIGIAPEYHNSIFGMFKRLHRQSEYEGSGIGLAVCKKIVQRHNGQIGIESQAGKGSTFWFTVAAATANISVQKS
jgi:PAS domain S-box-containing protein